jgi:Xaa-Pro dipeptidase
LKELPQILGQTGLDPQGAVALELDVIPAAWFRRIQEQLFPGHPIVDLSPLIRIQRMVKSAYENPISPGRAILDQVHAQVPELLQPGLSELEVSAALEYRLRLLGHQGLVRVRNWDLEVYYGHVLSGVSGLLAAYTDTPSGGPGFSAAFPQGPSLKKLAPNEPISIDLAACVNGYVVDMTRMYALGSLPSRAWEAWEAVESFTSFIPRGQSRDQSRGNFSPALGRGPGPGPGGLLHGVGMRPGQFPGPRGGVGAG